MTHSQDRPRIAHVTNHGYAGVEVPYGGAPDTGGQNVYVNCIVETMVELGFDVTVFTRGGFPFFGSDRRREGVEPWGEHARYVYVPGGGDGFIRKEEISIALDEEVSWIERYVADEARRLGCAPWEVFDLVDTHYWDAGVIGVSLVRRWQAARALELLSEVLGRAVSEAALEAERRLGFRSPAAAAFEQVVGRTLLAETDRRTPGVERVRAAVRAWLATFGNGAGAGAVEAAAAAYEAATAEASPALHPVAAADAVGAVVVATWDPGGRRLREALAAVDRHVFTAHSLAALKEENYRESPLEVRRALRFTERQGHEELVCRSTRAFAATSTEIAERLRSHMGVGTGQIFYFPAGVDRRTFRAYGEAARGEMYAYLAARSGLPVATLREATLVFETSRMDRTKRKDLLLAAFGDAARGREGAYLFIGGGPEGGEVYKELEAMREADPELRARAFLLGFVPDALIPLLFDRADLFVTASEMEGFGLSAAQAAAVGTPIVTSDLVPFALQYAPDEAVVLPAGDRAAFAEAIARLLDAPEERRWRGAGLAERTAQLDWTSQTLAFLAHLRRHGIPVREP